MWSLPQKTLVHCVKQNKKMQWIDVCYLNKANLKSNKIFLQRSSSPAFRRPQAKWIIRWYIERLCQVSSNNSKRFWYILKNVLCGLSADIHQRKFNCLILVNKYIFKARLRNYSCSYCIRKILLIGLRTTVLDDGIRCIISVLRHILRLTRSNLQPFGFRLLSVRRSLYVGKLFHLLFFSGQARHGFTLKKTVSCSPRLGYGRDWLRHYSLPVRFFVPICAPYKTGGCPSLRKIN